MKHLFRFLGNKASDGTWSLRGDEVTHLLKVVRLTENDEFEVADENGSVAKCRYKKLSKSAIELDVLDQCYVDSETNVCDLFLGAIAPKDFDEILPALVEMGLSSVHLFGQKSSGKQRLQNKAERYDRIIDSAMKQSKRAYRMELKVHPDLETAVSTYKGSTKVEGCYFLDASEADRLHEVSKTVGRCCVVVGGEAGLSEYEIQFLRSSGFKGANLGKNILRARTAAIVAPWEILSRI
jgi:16S rRNA (uracil1498-N3)-methyltransferase